MPIYFMSLFCNPRTVSLRIEKIRTKKKKHPSGWGSLGKDASNCNLEECLSKGKGDLGVQKLSTLK